MPGRNGIATWFVLSMSDCDRDLEEIIPALRVCIAVLDCDGCIWKTVAYKVGEGSSQAPPWTSLSHSLSELQPRPPPKFPANPPKPQPSFLPHPHPSFLPAHPPASCPTLGSTPKAFPVLATCQTSQDLHLGSCLSFQICWMSGACQTPHSCVASGACLIPGSCLGSEPHSSPSSCLALALCTSPDLSFLLVVLPQESLTDVSMPHIRTSHQSLACFWLGLFVPVASYLLICLIYSPPFFPTKGAQGGYQ